jgi:hypothetical protein
MTERHDPPPLEADTDPTMGVKATAVMTGTGWVARPRAARTRPERWGIVYRPTGRWVAYGSEARCRALAKHLTEVDAILDRSAPPESPIRILRATPRA